MTKRTAVLLLVLLLLVAGGYLFYVHGSAIWAPYYFRIVGARSVEDVVAKYGGPARARLEPHFQRAGVKYPPRRIALLAFKNERRVALWAAGERQSWRFIRNYPIQAASGGPGPKLREGDRQVPEGLYRISHLNPMSSYHLSMKVDYPNAFDRRMAQRDRRTNLGGDIFIHGKAVSIGCLALGDPAIEELFTLVATTGHGNVRVIIAPHDLRIRAGNPPPGAPAWTAQLYGHISAALRDFPMAMESGSQFDVTGRRKVLEAPLKRDKARVQSQ